MASVCPVRSLFRNTGFREHIGYGTARHRAAIDQHGALAGASALVAPVRELVYLACEGSRPPTSPSVKNSPGGLALCTPTAHAGKEGSRPEMGVTAL